MSDDTDADLGVATYTDDGYSDTYSDLYGSVDGYTDVDEVETTAEVD